MFIDAIKIDGYAADMVIDDEENSLFLVLPDKNKLQKINLTSKQVVSEIEVGENAYAVAVESER